MASYFFVNVLVLPFITGNGVNNCNYRPIVYLIMNCKSGIQSTSGSVCTMNSSAKFELNSNIRTLTVHKHNEHANMLILGRCRLMFNMFTILTL